MQQHESSSVENSAYSPAEDSQILAAAVEKYAFGSVLDMGTGSGIQAITAARKENVRPVTAVDISDKALIYAAAAAKKEKANVKFLKSDLFRDVKGKFDTIIFNPPYLPQDKGIVDEAIYGGKHGYETLQRFINSCGRHLNNNGIILIAFSSQTNKQKVDEAIEMNCLEFEELEQKHLFFETLYVYLIRKLPLLLELQRKRVENARLFAKGNRGIIYKGDYRGKDVAVKAQRKDTAAVAAIENEANWLKKLNKEGIGPKLLIKGENWFCCEFVEGQFILDFISGCGEKRKIIAAVKNVLEQARMLDKLKVNKEEMLRPQKHTIIGKKGKVTMLDFERCHRSATPKNVTQFCQFLASGFVVSLLRQKGIIIERDNIIAAAKDYKHNQSDERFKKVESQLGLA